MGLEAAIEFADIGKKVTVVEMLDQQGAFMHMMQTGSSSGAGELRKWLDQRGIEVKYCNKLKEVCDDKVVCEDVTTGKEVEYKCDTVLLAMGMRPRSAKVAELRHCAAETSVFHVGDCHDVGTIGTSVNEAFRCAVHI